MTAHQAVSVFEDFWTSRVKPDNVRPADRRLTLASRMSIACFVTSFAMLLISSSILY